MRSISMAAACSLISATALAQPAIPAAPSEPPADAGDSNGTRVVVEGRRTVSKSSLSDAAQAMPTPTYILDRAKLEALPFSDATDLLRSTPGITFGSSSPGGDVGDDISIRGFNGFHGAATAIFIDGVPVNWSHTNTFAHGGTDINWLVPEMIERAEIIKGPFSALYGNYNLSGVINIVTKASDSSSAAIEGARYGGLRATGTYSQPLGAVTPFLLVDALDRNGYRDHSAYRRYNAFNKLSFSVPGGRLALRINASVRDFESAGFLLASDVRSGAVSRRSAAPDALGDNGRIEYASFVVNYLPDDPTGISTTVYAANDRYRLADTSFGAPQTIFRSERSYGGWRVLKSWQFERALLTLGTDGQGSTGDNFNAEGDGNGNVGGAVTSDNRFKDLSAGVFAQGQWRVLDALKLVGGLRYDRFETSVDNRLFSNSGKASSDVVSPKVGVVYSPLTQLQLFANTGRGLRSPAANELSPNRAGAAFNGGLDPARLKSSDLGFTWRPTNAAEITAAVFRTDTERELRRDPSNPVNVINIGGTSRDGYEVIAEWSITDRLRVSASHTDVDTRIDNTTPPQANLVITVPKNTQTAALSWQQPLGPGLRLQTDVFAQRIGQRPLAADGSLYAESHTTYGAKFRLRQGNVSGFLQLDYVPKAYSSDFVFDLGSGPVFDPRPRVSARVGVRYAFD